MSVVAGRSIPIRWNERQASAWVPDPIADLVLDLPGGVARRVQEALEALQRADEEMGSAWEPLARLLLRAEGVASSNIEGLRVPVEELAAAEIDPVRGGDASWIADNLGAVAEALDAADQPLTAARFHDWHRRLMRHGHLPPTMVGAFRPAQGWIGGSSPLNAVFVPPPPELVPALMDDLVTWANSATVDPVTRAAVLHAQFETIHPYGDGNGRLGRVLVGWTLRRYAVTHIPPPVSVLIARDPGGYLSGLHRFRTGSVAPWVGWFADVVRRAADATASFAERADAVHADWLARLAPVRADAGARRALEAMAAYPVVNAAVLAERIGVSERSARSALATLERCRIVEPLAIAAAGPGRPRQWWVAAEMVDLLRSWLG